MTSVAAMTVSYNNGLNEGPSLTVNHLKKKVWSENLRMDDDCILPTLIIIM